MWTDTRSRSGPLDAAACHRWKAPERNSSSPWMRRLMGDRLPAGCVSAGSPDGSAAVSVEWFAESFDVPMRHDLSTVEPPSIGGVAFRVDHDARPVYAAGRNRRKMTQENMR